MSSATESPQSKELLSVGHQCHAKQCYMVDFLPFKCDHCKHAFCAEHFKPEEHSCEKYDPSKHDRVAPTCPLCNKPVAIPIGQDPNIRMDLHINKECEVTTGRAGKVDSMPLCSRGRCGKRLFAPIRCDGCSKQFCPEHRYPSSHLCNSGSAPSGASALGAKLANQTSASSAAMAAIKRSMASVNIPSPQTTMAAKPPSESLKPSKNPFSKTDRCGSSSSQTQTSTSDDSSRISESIPSLPANRERCNPFDAILTTSWTPPPLFT